MSKKPGNSNAGQQNAGQQNQGAKATVEPNFNGASLELSVRVPPVNQSANVKFFCGKTQTGIVNPINDPATGAPLEIITIAGTGCGVKAIAWTPNPDCKFIVAVAQIAGNTVSSDPVTMPEIPADTVFPAAFETEPAKDRIESSKLFTVKVKSKVAGAEFTFEFTKQGAKRGKITAVGETDIVLKKTSNGSFKTGTDQTAIILVEIEPDDTYVDLKLKLKSGGATITIRLALI